MRWLPRQLAVQLMLLTSLCLVFSIMGYGAYRANLDVEQARHSISGRMLSLAKNIATLSEHFLRTKEPQSIEPLMQQLATVDGIYSVQVTDLEGRPISEVVNQNLTWSPRYSIARIAVPDAAQPYADLTTQAYSAKQHDFLAGTGGTMTAWQRIGDNTPLGWVRVNYRLDTFDAITRSIYQQAIKAVALAVLVTLLLLWLLLRPSLRALRDATEFARHIDSAMGSQLKVSHSGAEIQALGSALNVLSERLFAQHAELSTQKFALDQHAIVSITDLDGNITYANQRFCDISGYTVQELLGKNHRIVKSDEHPPALFEDMWHTITQCRVWRGDVKNRRKDGTFYWVSATIVPLVGQDGLPHHYIGIRTDISANKLLEENLKLAKDEAEAATRAKAQFLANMSHEIRTPMNAVLGMLRLLQNADLNTRQFDYANKAEGAALSLLGLLNDILDFSKIDAGKMTLEVHSFRLDKLMRDLSVIVSANLGNKPVEVLFDIDPTTPKALLGDALRLQQVLINLASNAVKFTAAGEVVVSIRPLARTPTHTTLLFSVRDSGIGIAPEKQQHIFSGFSQAEASTTRRFGGTGLGLSISRKLLSLMGAELMLESTVGKGSTFSFTLTLPVSAVPLAEAAPHTPAHHPSAANLRVLVVDDNACAREVLGAMAESLGWQVDMAPDGETALALVQARRSAGEPPHQAMFIDWQMPGMDGWGTIEALQSTHTDTQPPIVVMVTAHGRDMLTQRSAQDQARLHGFLVKPVTASMLLDAVSDALASRTPTEATPHLPARPQPLSGLRLLVVEDNFVNQQVAQEMLSQEGATVELADNGQLGVEAVRHAIETGSPFDAVLMDIQMPVMDGYDATRMLRQQLGLTELPIIAMTANAMASDREACLAVGMNEHIGKPFNLVQLVGLLLQLTSASASHASLRARPAAPASGAPPEPPLPPKGTVDVTAALERLGGNQALYARVLEAFLKDLVTQPAQLAHCLEHADLLGAARLLHTLKGLAATVGASYLAAVARKCELAVKAAQAQTDTLAALDPDKFYREFNAAVANTQTVLAQVAQGYTSPLPAPQLTSVSNSTLPAQALDLLAQLHSLLRASDMQAVTVFEQLGQSDALNRLPAYETLTKAMAAFDFAGAAVACELLRIQAEKI